MDTSSHDFSERDFVRECLSENLTTPDDVARAERVAIIDGLRTDQVLNRLGIVSDDDFIAVWSRVSGFALLTEDEVPIAAILSDRLKASYLFHARLLPVSASGGMLVIACCDPLDRFAFRAVAAKTGLDVVVRLAAPQEIGRAIERLYGTSRQEEREEQDLHRATTTDLETLRELASDAPVIRLVQTIVERAVEARASDIHFTISRQGPKLRFRTDGVLKDAGALVAVHVYDAVISRLKIMAGLDIAERRLPQDGSTRCVVGGQEVDLRVATMPHLVGEGIVIRILDRSAIALDFAQLGMAESFIAQLAHALQQPSGLVLMTGPTGSGKTTTLYAALRTLVRPDRNIITIEDPVEYQIDGVTQIEVDQRIGFGFATALRAALRQDPDVILLGEIRDGETASIAARAAMTGHLVLASLHTNSAAAALPRLIDLGVEPYLVSSTVRAVMAQRLVRRVCRACSAIEMVEAGRLRAIGGRPPVSDEPWQALKACGCAMCNGTGYSGRMAVTEFMALSPALRAHVAKAADVDRIEAAAMAEGMRRLGDHAIDLLFEGRTTMDEVERVLGGGIDA